LFNHDLDDGFLPVGENDPVTQPEHVDVDLCVRVSRDRKRPYQDRGFIEEDNPLRGP
jgi:hypothetical protein